MKFQEGMAICVIALLSGCASSRPSARLGSCTRDAALARGARDGSSGRKSRPSFARSCTSDTRAAAVAAYREGFESSRAKRKSAPTAQREEADSADLAELEIDNDADDGEVLAAESLPRGSRAPSAVPWVCEIEASSKVFTGVGGTQGEALGSARANCGSHFQASNCTKSDCRLSM